MTRTLTSIQRGIAMLDERRAANAPVPVMAVTDPDEGYGAVDEIEDEEQGASPAGRR